jgi:hypothetical protein
MAVFLNLTKNFNQWLGPFLLRQGLRARYVLGQGVLRDSPRTDALLWIPIAQKLISLEVHDECQKAVLNGRVEPTWREYMSGFTPSAETETFERPDDTTRANRPSDAELRIQVLEKYLRPALVQNEHWGNVQTWQLHNRFLQWARTELLLAKHGPDLRAALDAFPAVRQSPQLTGSRSLQRRMGGRLTQMLAGGGSLPLDQPETNADSNSNSKLPTSVTLSKAFRLNDWSRGKDHGATGKEMRRIATEHLGGRVIELRGKSLRFVDAEPDSDVSKLTLEEILEAAGGHVMNCGPLNALCEEAGVYQLWTRDYIEHLGKYLLKRTEAFGGETIVLDVGAGDGLLAQSLRNYFEKGAEPIPSRKSGPRRGRPVQKPQSSSRRPPLKIPSVVAADDGSWSITVSKKANVEKLGVEEAIARYATDSKQQVIVVCSWMPMGDDWTPIFRKGGVDEYILIGECDDGQCGDNWETWGNHDFLSEVADKELDKMDNDRDGDKDEDSQTADAETSMDQSLLATPRAYETEGYARNDIDDLLPHQFSRYDCAVSKFGKTVSFRRVARS